MARLLLPLLLFPLCIACGESAGVDRSDPRSVAQGVLRALAGLEFDELKRLMSPTCYAAFERDLTIFQTNLARPDLGVGPQTHRIGREQLGADWDKAAKAASAGGQAGVLRLLLRLQPFPDPPELVEERTYPEATRRSWLYRRTEKITHQIDLELKQGLWIVQYIGF